jgi:sugar (pentulose or hexulose) kinase
VSVVGIDLGTSGVRAVAFAADGRTLASRSHTLQLSRPATGTVELDAERIVAAAEAALAGVAAEARGAGDPVRAVAFSVLGEAVVPVGANGMPSAPVAVSMDTRGDAAAVRLDDRRGRFTQITGQPLHGMFSGFKIASGAGPHARAWRDAHAYRCMGDLLTERWTGTAVIDYSQAARTGLFDVATRSWSDEIIDALAVDAPWLRREKLPSVEPGGVVVGEIDAATAARLGVDPGTPVVAGAHDQAAAYLGGGGAPGIRSTISFGSSDCVTVGTNSRPSLAEGTGFASYPVDDELWVTLAGTAAGGWALEWFAGIVGSAVGEVFAALADRPPALLMLPYLAGSGTLDNDSRGRGVIHGLALETTRPELARAVVEAAGFEFAKILDAFGAHGVVVGELVVSGSGAANLPALQCRAEAAGVALTPTVPDASARGAALLAARGAGIDAPGLASLDVPAGQRCAPTVAQRDWYASQRRAYRELYASTRAIAHHLAAGPAAASPSSDSPFTSTLHEQENTP